MQMIVVYSAAIEISGKEGIYVSWFGIPTNETTKDRRDGGQIINTNILFKFLFINFLGL